MNEKWVALFIGIMAAVVIASFFMPSAEVQDVPLTCVETQQAHDAYRLCMQTAAATGCKMQVEDFVAFAELERELKECGNVN